MMRPIVRQTSILAGDTSNTTNVLFLTHISTLLGPKQQRGLHCGFILRAKRRPQTAVFTPPARREQPAKPVQTNRTDQNATRVPDTPPSRSEAAAADAISQPAAGIAKPSAAPTSRVKEAILNEQSVIPNDDRSAPTHAPRPRITPSISSTKPLVRLSTPPAPRAIRPGPKSYAQLLSSATAPIQLYTSYPTLRLHVLSYTTSVFALYQASFNLQTYLAFSSSPLLIATGATVATLWAFACAWFAATPAKLIAGIRALPTTRPTGDPKNYRPMLEFTPVPLVPIGRGYGRMKPFVVPASGVTRDATIEGPVRAVAEGTAKGRGLVADVVNVFSRRRFVYFHVPGRGKWKIEVPGKQDLGSGAALEEIVDLDKEKMRGLRWLFSR